MTGDDDQFTDPMPVAGYEAPTVLDASFATSVGERVGPYRILEMIGEGGFGSVYLAEQEHPVRRLVALKILKPGVGSQEVIARFDAERQALAMMDHPNIAKVLDAATSARGRPYFVMELVKGVPITHYCDSLDLGIADRLSLFIDVCHAVQHAHQKGIIHRDLKPTNVLVTLRDGKPMAKVIDFGIAKATSARLTDNTLHTQMHQFIGTPQYMSPEQAGMTELDVDTRSDIYSLGVMLYELLAGIAPFDSQKMRQATIGEVQRMIQEDAPKRPSSRLSELLSQRSVKASSDPPAIELIASRRRTDPARLVRSLQGDLDWIVMKCLEKDRTRRYETAKDLAADVQHSLANEPISARRPTLRYRLGRFARRNRKAMIGTAAAGAMLALALVGLIFFAVRESSARTRADLERDQAMISQTDLVFLLVLADDDRFTVMDIRPTLRECLARYESAGPLARKQAAAALWALGRDEEVHGDPDVAADLYRQALARMHNLLPDRGDELIFGEFEAFRSFAELPLGVFRRELTVRTILDDASHRLEQLTNPRDQQ